MKKITVFADFDFLSAPQEIGTLDYERVRGNDHFAFKYSIDWLKSNGGIILSGDLMNVSSQQHPREGSNVFGFIKDSFPDRWGRLLLDRRERILAKAEHRDVRQLRGPANICTKSHNKDLNRLIPCYKSHNKPFSS